MIASGEGQTERQTEIARVLIERGADVNAQDYMLGYTALSYARTYGYTEIEQLLRQAGATQ